MILWNTGEAGAWEFVENVRDIFGADARPEVFLYPTYEPPESGRPGSDGTSRDTRNRPDTRAAEELFVRPNPWWKRAVDIAGSAFGMIALSPLLVGTALAIRWTSPGPILFRQKRDGLGGKPFTIYKFRTMYIDAEARKEALRKLSEQDGPAFKLKDDPRITPLGNSCGSRASTNCPNCGTCSAGRCRWSARDRSTAVKWLTARGGNGDGWK